MVRMVHINGIDSQADGGTPRSPHGHDRAQRSDEDGHRPATRHVSSLRCGPAVWVSAPRGSGGRRLLN
jgi:hypothetical protein